MSTYKEKWSASWQQPAFRKKLIAGLLLVIITLAILPIFFQAIEKRNGPVLNDWVLQWLPIADVSIPIFVFIWAATLVGLVRCVQEPDICIVLVWSYLLVCLSRLISIWVVTLNPPHNLIALIDPISNTFYGKKFVTKDLFYSGHTSSIFVIFLSLQKKGDKLFLLLATIAVGLLLLIQHVHYTIDVVTAPVFTLLCYYLAKKITANTRLKTRKL